MTQNLPPLPRASLSRGFIDLHCHLLPGVDDGAKTLADALEMASALVDLGFCHVAVSPHARRQYAPLAACEAAFSNLVDHLAEGKVPLSLQLSAENAFLEDGFWGEVNEGKVRTLGASRCVLVEAPYLSPLPSLLEGIFQLRVKGYVPLIAHPERCLEFERKGRAKEAVLGGALLQLDIGALTGRYGREPKKRAWSFLEQGLYAVASTDLHSPIEAREWVGKAMRELRAQAGEPALWALMRDTPARLLGGDGPLYLK